MTASVWIFLINTLKDQLFSLWTMARQAQGEAIPEWEELFKRNDSFQAKVDAEKQGG